MAKPSLTDRDIKVLADAWSCMKSDPQIDYDKLAEVSGSKDGTAAYKVLWNVKRKLRELTKSEGDGSDGAAASSPAKRASPAAKRTPARRTPAKRGAAAGAAAGETPTKSRASKKKVVEKSELSGGSENDHGENEEEEDPGRLVSPSAFVPRDNSNLKKMGIKVEEDDQPGGGLAGFDAFAHSMPDEVKQEEDDDYEELPAKRAKRAANSGAKRARKSPGKAAGATSHSASGVGSSQAVAEDTDDELLGV